ncbi:MAG: hypothetical protein WC225_05620 [Acholeplasmataceae bacterium]|nr:hypothetical protein [Acholeplasmataceae bacterium]
MKKLIKKGFTLLILILTTVLIVGCDDNHLEEPDDPSNNRPTTVTQVSQDEIIYVNMKPNGQMESIKASQHISQSVFTNYKVYGQFLANGHLNISNSQARITVEDGLATIPSLSPQRNMFYTLNLDPEYYEQRLPYIIRPTYKLNGLEVGYQDLVHATGHIELNYDFIANEVAHVYYQQAYSAQVQIPLNLKTMTILSAPGVMQTLVVGSDVSLVYMIMPGTSQKITIELDVIDFHYDGLQAVLQPMDLLSFATDFIELDQLTDFEMESMESQIDLLIQELAFVDDQMSPLFKELLPELPTFIEDQATMIGTELEKLVTGLNDPQLDQAFTALTSIISYSLNYQSQRDWFRTHVAEIKTTIDHLSNHYDDLMTYLASLQNELMRITALTNTYTSLYQEYEDVMDEVNQIKTAVTLIANLGELDLETLVENKVQLTDQFYQMSQSSKIIQTKLQTLIVGMYPFANQFQFLVEGFTPLIAFFTELDVLHDQFIQLAARLRMGLDAGWFSSMVSAQFETLYEELVKEDEEMIEPGLIQGLELALSAQEQLGELSALKDVYTINSETNLRPIDELAYGFILINEALTLPQNNQEQGFFEALSFVQLYADILGQLPNLPEGSLPSFLSETNPEPCRLQFIIKHRGF